MFPALTLLAQTGPKATLKIEIVGRLKTRLNNLFALHSSKIDLKAVEADTAKMQASGLDWIVIVLQLLQKYGPAIIDLLAQLRALFNK